MEPAPPLIERLHLYYARHNASKLDSLNAIVAVWATREADLFIALETKYGEAPPLSEGWVAISASVNASRRVSTNAHALVAAPTRGAPSWTAALDAASAPDIPPRSAASGRQQQKGGPRLRLGRLFKRKLDGGSEDAAAAAPAERGAPADLVARSPSLHLPSGDPFDSQVLRAMDVRALERALPVWQRGNDWRLLYSLQRHGAHVGTFIERVKRSNPTLIVLSTGHGEICGAYASEAWQSTAAFCGDGERFLFSCGGAGEGGGSVWRRTSMLPPAAAPSAAIGGAEQTIASCSLRASPPRGAQPCRLVRAAALSGCISATRSSAARPRAARRSRTHRSSPATLRASPRYTSRPSRSCPQRFDHRELLPQVQ